MLAQGAEADRSAGRRRPTSCSSIRRRDRTSPGRVPRPWHGGQSLGDLVRALRRGDAVAGGAVEDAGTRRHRGAAAVVRSRRRADRAGLLSAARDHRAADTAGSAGAPRSRAFMRRGHSDERDHRQGGARASPGWRVRPTGPRQRRHSSSSGWRRTEAVKVSRTRPRGRRDGGRAAAGFSSTIRWPPCASLIDLFGRRQALCGPSDCGLHVSRDVIS